MAFGLARRIEPSWFGGAEGIKMDGFNKCPRCGLLDVRRRNCECGYMEEEPSRARFQGQNAVTDRIGTLDHAGSIVRQTKPSAPRLKPSVAGEDPRTEW